MTSIRSATSNHRSQTFNESDRMRALNALGSLSSINPDGISNGMPLSSNYLPNSMPHTSYNNSHVPPPVPPRTDATRSLNRFGGYSGYSGMNNYCSPYSRFSTSMYGMGIGGAYGGYRSPYSRYGMTPDTYGGYNSFIQLAEESTRPAFESIESVVDIVGSISMMLESTYHAVYSSYNAIIGVVDQFGRLKDHLAEVLSFLALIRGLKYLCLKFLYLLRLRKSNPDVEAAWSSAKSASASDIPGFAENKKSPWPFFVFVGLVIGAPWLMFKILAKSVAVKKPVDLSSWKMSNGHIKGCMAAYDFLSNRRGELCFHAGDILYIAPSHLQKGPRGWLLACDKDKNMGLIPQNYLRTAVAKKPSKPADVQPDQAFDTGKVWWPSTSKELNGPDENGSDLVGVENVSDPVNTEKDRNSDDEVKS